MANQAGMSYDRKVAALRRNDLDEMNPIMAERVRAAITECNAAGLDVMCFEVVRSDELAELYFAHGASRAHTGRKTWHSDRYKLAVDVISKSRQWSVWPDTNGRGGDPAWYRPVVEIFKQNGLAWGGDWPTFRDGPHFHPATDGAGNPFPKSPTESDADLAEREGAAAVWAKYGLVEAA